MNPVIKPLPPRLLPPAIRACQYGFTTIELMVVVAILAIVLGLAAPSFKHLTQNNRITTKINILSSDYQYARSEAVRRGLPVVLCASINGESCTATEQGDDKTQNWGTGWIIFNDDNNNHTLDAAAPSAEKVLRVQGALTGGDILIGNRNFISFNRNGFSPAVLFSLRTEPQDVSVTRCLVSNLAGQQKIIRYDEKVYGKLCNPS